MEEEEEEASSFFFPRFILAAPLPIFSTASNVLSSESVAGAGTSATNADSVVSLSDMKTTEEEEGWMTFVLQDGATKAFTLAADAAIATMVVVAFIVMIYWCCCCL